MFFFSLLKVKLLDFLRLKPYISYFVPSLKILQIFCTRNIPKIILGKPHLSLGIFLLCLVFGRKIGCIFQTAKKSFLLGDA